MVVGKNKHGLKRLSYSVKISMEFIEFSRSLILFWNVRSFQMFLEFLKFFEAVQGIVEQLIN